MDTYSAAEVGRICGTSIPRVQRAIDRLGMGSSRQARGRVSLTPAQARRVCDHLGAAPRIPGLSRTQVKVLCALARAPRGLTSARAVARRAGVSPTAAGRSVAALESVGLVRRRRTVVAAGSARAVELICVNASSPRWPALATQLSGVSPTLPESAAQDRVPERLRHLFWNVDESQLSVGRAAGFVARRLLVTGDPDGLAWGVAHLPAGAWLHAARARGLDPRDRAMARNIARRAGR